MPKKFYTELDIKKLADEGEKSLEITPDVVLTDLAFEMAKKIGFQLLNSSDTPPGAPLRPYISKDPRSSAPKLAPQPVEVIKEVVASQVVGAPLTTSTASSGAQDSVLADRIRNDVNTRLGGKIDPALLELILRRVLEQVGVK
jgi:hypothetical protein